MKKNPRRHKKTTIKIPEPLYRKIGELIEDTGYNSVTDFITFVLRDLVGNAAADRSEGDVDMDRTRRKLKGLGYL